MTAPAPAVHHSTVGTSAARRPADSGHRSRTLDRPGQDRRPSGQAPPRRPTHRSAQHIASAEHIAIARRQRHRPPQHRRPTPRPARAFPATCRSTSWPPSWSSSWRARARRRRCTRSTRPSGAFPRSPRRSCSASTPWPCCVAADGRFVVRPPRPPAGTAGRARGAGRDDGRLRHRRRCSRVDGGPRSAGPLHRSGAGRGRRRPARSRPGPRHVGQRRQRPDRHRQWITDRRAVRPVPAGTDALDLPRPRRGLHRPGGRGRLHERDVQPAARCAGLPARAVRPTGDGAPADAGRRSGAHRGVVPGRTVRIARADPGPADGRTNLLRARRSRPLRHRRQWCRSPSCCCDRGRRER